MQLLISHSTQQRNSSLQCCQRLGQSPVWSNTISVCTIKVEGFKFRGFHQDFTALEIFIRKFSFIGIRTSKLYRKSLPDNHLRKLDPHTLPYTLLNIIVCDVLAVPCFIVPGLCVILWVADHVVSGLENMKIPRLPWVQYGICKVVFWMGVPWNLILPSIHLMKKPDVS